MAESKVESKSESKVKPFTVSDKESLEYLMSVAQQNGANPQEVLSAMVREFQRSGRMIKIHRVWSLKTLVDQWRKELGEERYVGPLTADLVKTITEALKVKLKETEQALKENDITPSARERGSAEGGRSKKNASSNESQESAHDMKMDDELDDELDNELSSSDVDSDVDDDDSELTENRSEA